MYRHQRPPYEDVDDELTTDFAAGAGDSGLGMSSNQRRHDDITDWTSDNKPVLISRDGKSSTCQIPIYSPAGTMCSYSDQRVDSGFDSYNKSERYYSSESNFYLDPCNEGSTTSSFHSTTSMTADTQNTTSRTTDYDDDLKHEYVCDSGLGLSEHCISTDSAIDVTDRLDKLNLGQISEHTVQTSSHRTTCHSPKPVPDYAAITQKPSAHPFRWIDAYQQDIDGDTTLHLAIIHELQKEVLNLVDNVPHPTYLNLQNNLLQTALHLAVLTNQPKIVRKLVITGAALDIRDRRGNTALHIACQEGNLPCAEELLCPVAGSEIYNTSYQQLEGYGRLPDLELRNYDGQNCVHLSTHTKHLGVLRLLKQCGADINAQEGKSGRTALHYAVEARDIALVKFLVLECHADTNTQTFAGLTPIQLAYNHNEMMVCQLLNLGAYNVGPPPSDSESDSSSDEMTGMDTAKDGDYDFLVNGAPLSSF